MSPGLLSFVVVLLGLGLFFRYLERTEISSKEVALIAVLSAFAVVGRIAFAAIPGIQFTTFVVLVSGYVFGCTIGFTVGCTAALVSNLFLGQGPWTPWQMAAWGLCGGSAGIVCRFSVKSDRAALILLGVVWGYLFGWIMNLWMWLTFFDRHDLTTWLSVTALSFSFDTAHAASNVVFAAIFGGDFIRVLERFRKRLTATYA